MMEAATSSSSAFVIKTKKKRSRGDRGGRQEDKREQEEVDAAAGLLARPGGRELPGVDAAQGKTSRQPIEAPNSAREKRRGRKPKDETAKTGGRHTQSIAQ